MKTRIFTLLVAFAFLAHTAIAQVSIFTEPDFAFDGASLMPILEQHVRDVQALESIRVPDSVVIEIEVSAEGELETTKVLFGYSALHIDKLYDLLPTAKFGSKKGKLTLAVVYPPLAEIPYQISALTGVPETQVCNDYDSKNETFRLACFRYLNEENTKNIAGPDSVERQVADGWAMASFQIGVDGQVKQVTFNRASFNPILNDIVVDQASQIRFLDGGYVGKKQVSYEVPYSETFMYLESDKELEYLDKASELYEQKRFYQSAFMMQKAKSLDYKLTKQEVNMLASAYLLEGDISRAFYWWRTNFKEDELKDMKMVPKRVGDIYEVSLVPYVKEDNVSNEAVSFVVVEKKPVYPGCEDLQNQEEQFNCFNRGIMQHIGKNFKYPTVARQQGIQGKVYVSFVIEKDGGVSNVEIARGVQPILDIECLRVICTLPKMEPAYQRGKTVRMLYTVPINAKLQ